MNPNLLLRRAILLVLVGSCALLVACGEQAPIHYVKQPTLLNKATRQKVVLHVEWGADAVRRNCKATAQACAKREFDAKTGEWHASVYLPQEPDDFNDVDALVTLGHETWHALGANHEEL